MLRGLIYVFFLVCKGHFFRCKLHQELDAVSHIKKYNSHSPVIRLKSYDFMSCSSQHHRRFGSYGSA